MATINDIVLIYIENQPMVFARIEDILPDHKTGWFHVKLLLLQVPLKTVTWILQDIHIDGDEFTMADKNVRIELIKSPEEIDHVDMEDDKTDKKGRGSIEKKDGNVVYLKF
mmetsp:Transcript_617/g.453  ORF Transcript_617/g.453 Transcript_617/m.453 type:complete len:111 (-) Transcript_617:181-513(-)